MHLLLFFDKKCDISFHECVILFQVIYTLPFIPFGWSCYLFGIKKPWSVDNFLSHSVRSWENLFLFLYSLKILSSRFGKIKSSILHPMHIVSSTTQLLFKSRKNLTAIVNVIFVCEFLCFFFNLRASENAITTPFFTSFAYQVVRVLITNLTHMMK